MIVISDTTPIIALIKAGQLNLLYELYGTVMIPQAVKDELVNNEKYTYEAKQVNECSFLRVESVENLASVKILRNVTGLDAGESEALVLYGEKNADLLLMDEQKGRRIAKQMEVRHVGTVGILLMAYDMGRLVAEDVKKCIEIMLDSEIRLSKALCNKVMEYVGDIKR